MRSANRSGVRLYSRILFFVCATLVATGCIYEGPTAAVYLTNNSVYTVVGCFYGDADTDEWSANLLDSSIQPEELRIIEGMPREIIDIKIVFGDPQSTTNITRQDLTMINKLNLTMTFPAS